MGAFSAEWLALREPADRAARSARLAGAIAGWLPRRAAVRALDLAAGTGANCRYLAALLPPDQSWLLVDHDDGLLARAIERAPAERRIRIETRSVDLAAIDAVDIFGGVDLVTASALLDLVSEAWLRALAARCGEGGAAVLFALTYDGRIRCEPAEPEDELIRALVNDHQRTDKGFGPALGPGAVDAAERAFDGIGYDIARERSDWLLTPEAGRLQAQLIDGWADAAIAIAPDRASAIGGWRSRRLAHVAAGRSTLTVGHEDLAARLR